MQVNVVDVSSLNTHAAKNGRTYQSIEIMYKNDQGQAQSKKLMSFANPGVFKAAQEWQKGDVVHVSTEKDANGYWQWTAVGDAETTTDNRGGDTAAAPQAKASAPTTRVTGSNYETKEERAARQVMIVRQSSLSNAVATLALERNEPSTASANDVISLAKLYEGYVLGLASTNSGASSFANDVTDIEDIPF
tara:strand:- start:236 stop:808 length:573 start_codon:yes stop_codon:yes gene_type:complete